MPRTDRYREWPKRLELIKNCHSAQQNATDGYYTGRPTVTASASSAAENKFEADSRLRFISSGQAEQIHGLGRTNERVNVAAAKAPRTLSAHHHLT